MEVRPGYKQTEVGVIPEEWDVERLGELSEFATSGSRGWAQFYSESGALFIRSQNVRDGRLSFEDVQYVSPPNGAEGNRTKVSLNDLLITITGNSVGNVALVNQTFDEAYISQHVGLVRLKEPASGAYVCRYLSPNSPGNPQIAGSQSGQSKPGLNLQNLRDFFIALPPTSIELQAIAEALSDVDGLLGGLDRLIAKKRDLKQAARQQLLTGQTRLPGFNGEWRNTTLGQIISRFSTGLNPRQNFRLNSGGSFFYVTIKNFTIGQLLLDENCDLIDEAAFWRINERSDLRKDDVLFSSIGRVGDAYLITETPRNWNINESVFTLRPDKTQVVPLMLFHLLTDKTVKDALSQGVTGSTFKSIKQAQLKAIPCQLPASHKEQTAIAEVLTEMDTELAALEQRREKNRALKQAMMQELLTGRTRLVSPKEAHA